MSVIESPAVSDQPAWQAWLQLLRLHHWVKNLLVLAPLIAAHRMADSGLLLQAMVAVLAFGLCASAAYAFNDRIDRFSDRAHPDKRGRPVSDGRISPNGAAGLAAVLLVAGLGLSVALLNWSVTFLLLAYVLLAVVYSVWLKRLPVVDLFALVAFYGLRLLAGSLAVGIALSGWLLGFSLFLFGGLALLKRYAELVLVARRGDGQLPGRAYRIGSLEGLRRTGLGFSVAASLLLAAYAQSTTAEALYAMPSAFLGLAVLLLAWQLRAWSLASRGRIHHDPVTFALRDGPTWLGMLMATALLAWALAA